MDYTRELEQKRGHPNLGRLLSLLILAGLQAARSTNAENLETDGSGSGLNVVIVGPDYVTVGVPSSVECDANCTTCTYSMALGGQAAQGQSNALAFTINSWVEALAVTCTATDDESSLTATNTKQLQVLAGPANISIAGPDSVNPAVSHTYSCHAYCRPSCTYAWMVDKGPWIQGQGNVVAFTPQEVDSSKILICKATNSVSGLFVTAARNITVISGPSEVQIKGPDLIEIAELSKFVCTAECRPSCRYVSSVDAQTIRGSVVEVRVDHPLASISIKCEAQNTVSKRVATVVKTVQVKGPDHNLSARPETSAVTLLAAITTAAFRF